ncbi:MAG: lysylphosphatidylglycerol synthase transmembrane domain-containing protein [Thermodesulfobacteriota bacterium]|nr:lysylphosphatidylglycerol synthase transmembrane domain-containing protein [Thermodesulfobacteriota bacterium]
MKHKLKQFFLYSLGITIAFLIVLYIHKNKNVFSVLDSISPLLVVVMIICWLIIYALRGYRIKLLLQLFCVRSDPREWFGITMVGAMSSYLIPQAGFLAKGGYFKTTKNLSIPNYLSTQIIDYMVLFLSNSLVGISIIFFVNIEPELKIAITVFFTLFALCFVILYFIRNLGYYIEKRFNSIKAISIIQGILLVYKYPILLFKLIIANILSIFVLGLWYYLAYLSINIHIQLIDAVFFGIVLNFSIAVRLTPGNIGIQELILAFLSNLLAVKYVDGLTAAMILRSISIILSFSLGILFYFILLKNFVEKN